jgi:hypothetical protein
MIRGRRMLSEQDPSKNSSGPAIGILSSRNLFLLLQMAQRHQTNSLRWHRRKRKSSLGEVGGVTRKSRPHSADLLDEWPRNRARRRAHRNGR